MMLASSSILAQTTRKPVAKPKMATVNADKDAQIKALQAEIEDLKKQLSSQNTATEKSASSLGSLELEAGLVFGSGDVKPVSRVEFHLYKVDPETLIRTPETHELWKNDQRDWYAKYNRQSPYQNQKFEDFTFHDAARNLSSDSLQPTFRAVAIKALLENKVASIMTGFDGKGTFENIPVGNYYVFATYKLATQTASWRVPVTIKSGVNKIILDNNNMN